jgi:superkiller protein 3
MKDIKSQLTFFIAQIFIWISFFIFPSIIVADMPSEPKSQATIKKIEKDSNVKTNKATQYYENTLTYLREDLKFPNYDNSILLGDTLSKSEKESLLFINQCIDQRKFHKAIQESKRMADASVNSKVFLYMLSRAYMRAGDNEFALEECDKLLAIFADFTDAQLLRTCIIARQGDFENAEKEGMQILDRHPSMASAHYLLGDIYMLVKKYAEAEIEFKTASKLDDKNIDYRLGVVRSIFMQGRKEEAISEIKKIVEKEPDNSPVYYWLISFLISSDRLKEATEIYKKVTATEFPDISIFLLMIETYKAQGKKDEAIAEAQRILIFYPDNQLALIALSNMYIENKDYEKAMGYAEKLVETHSEDGLSYEVLGSVYEARNDFKKAEETYRKGIESNPECVALYGDWGWLYDQLAQYDRAIVLYRLGLGIDKNNTDLHYLSGIAYRKKELYDLAIEEFEKVIGRDPRYVAAYSSLGFVYYKKNMNDKALDLLNKALSLDPNHAMAYNHLGIIFEGKKENEKAIEMFKKAIELGKDNTVASYAHVNLSDLYGATGMFDAAMEEAEKIKNNQLLFAIAAYNLGCNYEGHDMHDKAIVSYQKAVELYPTYIDSYVNLSHVYVEVGKLDEALKIANEAYKINEKDPFVLEHLGLVYQNMEKYREAINWYEHAIANAQDSKDFKIYHPMISIGWCYLKIKDYDKALESYKKLALLYPGDIKALENIGYVYLEMKKYNDAEGIFKDIVSKYPDNISARVNLSYIYRQQGLHDQSIAEAEKVLLQNSNNTDAYINMGGAYLAKGMRDKALDIYKKVIEIDPSYAQRIGENYDKAYYNRGCVLAKEGKLQEAIEEYKISIMINSRFAGSHYNLACAYSKLEKTEEAIKCLGDAIRLDNDNKDYAKSDSAFSNIKKDSRFTKLIYSK